MSDLPPRPGRCGLRAAKLTAVVVCLTVLTSACGSGGAVARDLPSATPVLAPPASPSAANTNDAAKILAQYRGFWRTLTPASRAAARDRPALLAAYATNPALKSLLAGIEAQRLKGYVYYGVDELRPTIETLSVSRGTAVVNDCQDSTRAGLEDQATGRKLTAGKPRNHVVTTMHRSATGVWLVAFVTYPKTPC